MSKKSNKLLIGGALALGVYALVKGSAKAEGFEGAVNAYGMPIQEEARLKLAEEVEAAKDEGRINESQANEILTNFNTVYDDTKDNKTRVSSGMAAINQAYSAGVQLPRTSKVLKENVTVRNKSTGEVSTGNIVQLGTGSVKHISVKPVSSSSGGSSSSSRSSSGGSSSSSKNRVLKSNNATISRDSDGRLRIKL
jgi:hypothetical protein